MITLKSKREIGLMRDAGKLVAEAHQIAASMIAPGVTTESIDAAIERLFQKHSAIPLFKGYPGKVPFPAVTCMSINEQIVHGIPGPRELIDGDIVSVDTGCKYNGWCGDSAWTYPVGQVDEKSQRLLDVGRETLRVAIIGLKKRKRWAEVTRDMAKVISGGGFSAVDKFVGHGIGREMHEAPQVANHLVRNKSADDFQIQNGLVLAIEPMINAGKPGIRILKDHWTAVTVDGERSVHFEHTVAVTAEGPVILTEGVGEPLSLEEIPDPSSPEATSQE